MKLLIILLLSLFTVTTFSYANSDSQSPPFTPAQKAAIEKIVHDYLVSNGILTAHEDGESQSISDTQALVDNKQQLLHDPNTPSFQQTPTRAYVVEFFDYQCEHCQLVQPVVAHLIKTNPQVTFIFKELPIFGGSSEFAAKMALLSNHFGKYIAFHNTLFSISDLSNEQAVIDQAKKQGIDITHITAELNNPIYEKQIRDNFVLAQKIGVTGTPAFILSNGAETKFQLIPGATGEKELQNALNAMIQN